MNRRSFFRSLLGAVAAAFVSINRPFWTARYRRVSGYVPEPWPGVVNASVRDYLSEQERQMQENKRIMALLRAKGRVTFNGPILEWKVKTDA